MPFVERRGNNHEKTQQAMAYSWKNCVDYYRIYCIAVAYGKVKSYDIQDCIQK